MKRAAGLAVLVAIITLPVVIFWLAWPSAVVEQSDRSMPFIHKSPLPELTITPPFGFQWGDSMAHVQALIEYSTAEIVMRTATESSETWIVEGLVQPGLKRALFLFQKNALTAVELQCQYDNWPAEKYRNRLEELRAFFDAKYSDQRHGQPIVSKDDGRRTDSEVGYVWQLGQTNATVLSRSTLAPGPKHLSVSELVIRYAGGPVSFDGDGSDQSNRWKDTVISPVIAQKLQPDSDVPPPESDLGITNAKLLNTSDGTQTAFTLQLAVKLQQDASIDPSKAVVEVNFYDSLPDGQILLTDAQVNYNWPSRRDWKQNNPEMLAVNYIRGLGSSRQGGADRRFFGYIATVYYDGRLESVRADPLPLLNLFPIRSFISPFENAQSAAARGDYTSAARLYRRAADQGNLFALENLAWFYANGKGVQKDYRTATVFYERAALQNTARSLNALAWFLATCDDESIRNGPEAVRHATKACELSYWQEWKYIDTLAAACSAAGDFKRAVEYEQQALELKGLDDDVRKKMEERLALYRKRQSVRE